MRNLLNLLLAALLLAACNQTSSRGLPNATVSENTEAGQSVALAEKWVKEDSNGRLATSIGTVSYRNQPQDSFGNFGIRLNDQRILQGVISEEDRITGIDAIDYGGRITLLIGTWSGGASCCTEISGVQLGRSGSVLSEIVIATSDEYDPEWKKNNDSYESMTFPKDGTMMTAVLAPDGVSLRASASQAKKEARTELCDFMRNAIASSCVTDESNERDCSDIESSLSNVEASWFTAASNDPGFEFKSYMQACQNVCKGKTENTEGFAQRFCNKGK